MPKHSATRERIACAADELFCRFGPERTSMCDLAEALGMSSANIYKFFPSKKALVQEVVGRRLACVWAESGEIARGPGTAWQRLEQVLWHIFRANRRKFETKEQMLRLVIDSEAECREALRQFHADLRGLFAELLAEGTAAGELIPLSACEMVAFADTLKVALDPMYVARVTEPEHTERITALLALLKRLLTPSTCSAAKTP